MSLSAAGFLLLAERVNDVVVGADVEGVMCEGW